MSTAMASSNLTSGFVDLATFDEQEKYYYGGTKATTYFVRKTRKSTWFTQVPVCLSKSSGNPAFGQEWSVSVSRAGDYMTQNWLRLTVSSVGLVDTAGVNADKGLRWCRNFMHNLIRECTISFNDLVQARFDNYHLDFWTAFTVGASKRVGYDNMIGNLEELTNPRIVSGTVSDGYVLPSITLNLPLPLPHTRDSGVSLPTAALPYNDMRISFSFRNWSDMLMVDDSTAGLESSRAALLSDLVAAPTLSNVQVWANYAIVSNDERKRMGVNPRDIVIEQVQTSPVQNFSSATNPNPSYDIRLSHSVKVLFWGVRNKTLLNDWSNYTTHQPQILAAGNNLQPDGFSDPIATTSLVYENTNRLSHMGSDYFSLVQPFYYAPAIPTETGLHMYSYSLSFIDVDPKGSTNFGKLTNVSVAPAASAVAIAVSTGVVAPNKSTQSFDFVLSCVNNNIVRVSGGALGFPVL
jgi:hypothetical protein